MKKKRVGIKGLMSISRIWEDELGVIGETNVGSSV